METYSDAELIVAYRDGEETAFDFLVQRYVKPLYGFVYRMLGNAHDSEEIVQETFVKVWKHLNRFDAQKSFKAWLFSIAKNTTLDFIKKKKTIPFSHFERDGDDLSFLDEIPDEAPLPSAIMERMEDAQYLNRVVAHLPLLDQEALLLRYTYDCTFQEISDIVHEPLDTVKSRHRRALIKLSALLEKESEQSNNAPKLKE